MKRMIVSIVGALTVFASGARADALWNAATGDWSVVENWNPQVEPTSADYAKIDNGGTCTVSQAGEIAARVYIGSAAGAAGTLHLVSGDLTATNSLYAGNGTGATGDLLIDSGVLTIGSTFIIGTSGGSGHVIQTGGGINDTLNLNNSSIGNATGAESIYDFSGGWHTNKGAINIGNATSSRGTMNMTNDALLNSSYLYVGSGSKSSGTVIMKSTAQAKNQGLGVGRASGATGYVEIADSAVLTVNTGSRDAYIGEVAGATGFLVITNNGRLVDNKTFNIGYVAGGTGTVDLAGGSVYMNYNNNANKDIYVGRNGADGTLNLRGGILESRTNTAGQIYWGTLIVREIATSKGTVRGYGKMKLGGQLDNSGRIIADGYGEETNLDLSLFVTHGPTNAVANSVDNTTDNGWFAVNKGSLLLPSIAVTADAGDVSYNWGESVGDTDPDLVNSVRFTLHNASAGSVSGTLLAADRSDVPAAPKGDFIGVWKFATAGTFDSVTLTIRYDDAAALTAGIAESNLTCYKGDGSSWTAVAATVNTGTHTITRTEPLASLSYIAVGPQSQHQGTVMMVR